MYCIYIIMWYSHLNDIEISKTKYFILFELGTTLSQPIWSMRKVSFSFDLESEWPASLLRNSIFHSMEIVIADSSVRT